MSKSSQKPTKRRRPKSETRSSRVNAEQDSASTNGDPAGTVKAPLARWRLPLLLFALIGLTLGALLWGLPTYWTTQAEKALASGRYGDADSYFQLVQRLQPRNAASFLGQARAARCSGDPSRARALLSIAESKGASPSSTELERELLRIQNGASPDCIDRLPDMLVRSPEYGGEILEAFAVGFAAAGAPEQAIPYVDDWIAAAPTDARALQHKAELLATLGKKDDAESMFEAALRQEQTLVRARRGLARLKMELGKNEEALMMFDAAIAADSTDIDSQLIRCSVLLSMRRDDDALAGLRAILELDELNFAARHTLASKLSEKGQYQEVVRLIEPLMIEFADDVSLNYLLATAFTELGVPARADVHLKKHLEGRKALDNLGKLKFDLRERQDDGEGILRLAVGYLKYQWDEAEPWLVKAISLLPDASAPYREMSNFQRKKGDKRRANEYARAATARASQ